MTEAQRDCDRFAKERFESDGTAPPKPGRLKVMKLALAPVGQGGGPSAPESPRGGRFRDNKTATQPRRSAMK